MIFVFDLKLSSFFLLVPWVLSLPFQTWCLPKDSRFVWKDHLSSCTITCFTCRPLGPTKDFILSKVVKALSIIFLSSNSEQFRSKINFLPADLNLTFWSKPEGGKWLLLYVMPSIFLILMIPSMNDTCSHHQ